MLSVSRLALRLQEVPAKKVLLCLASLVVTGSFASHSAAGADLGSYNYRLGWIPDIEYAGSYVAKEKGYFSQEGFSSVNIIPGGAAASPVETMISEGKALIGNSAPDATAAANAQGADLRVIGAKFQKSAFCVMYMADKPIKTAADLIGKKIGVQASNEPIWASFLAANNIAADKVNEVSVQNDPAPLISGEIDGYIAYVSAEPVSMMEKGYKVGCMMFADNNYPLVGDTYVTAEDSIKNHRAEVEAAMTAEIKGWKDYIANPSEAAAITVKLYGQDQGLTIENQTNQAKAYLPLMQSAGTKQNGLFTMTKTQIDENVKAVAGGAPGVTADLFDMSILDDIYKKHPELK